MKIQSFSPNIAPKVVDQFNFKHIQLIYQWINGIIQKLLVHDIMTACQVLINPANPR